MFRQLTVAATLLVLLGVLGTLQYRWLGEVSNAERERLRSSLRARAHDFSQDFDRDITRVYAAFHVDPEAFDRDRAGVVAEAYSRAQAASSVGDLVTAVYVLEANPGGPPVLQRFDPAARTLAAAEWPKALETWKQQATGPVAPGMFPAIFMADAIDPKVPAFVVPLPTLKRIEKEGRIAIVPNLEARARSFVILLNEDRLRRQLVESLVTRHFGTAAATDYLVTIVSRDDPSQTIYDSAGAASVTPQTADVTTGLFDLHLDELSQFNLRLPPPLPPRTPDASAHAIKDRVAITIVRRAGRGGARVLTAGVDEQGAWQLLVRGKSGSLEAVVARSRRRNLAIGLGVLGLLGVSLLFVIGSAQRQQRLARQQLEFVAAVSHELRTPLAVIRSAGENLADGLVGDGDQVKRYGSLIRTEGRRLSGMIERVMEFAGITSGAIPRAAADVSIARAIEDAVGGLVPDARERGIDVVVRAGASLPSIPGDADALRSALQNVVGNAIKYSPNGSAVEIEAVPHDDHVRITIADHGIGIDAGDLPHVFKPFYRGRRAVDAQIRGTGVGLSIVRHVVEAHRGSIRVEARAGGGTVVTLILPAGARRGVGDVAQGVHVTT